MTTSTSPPTPRSTKLPLPMLQNTGGLFDTYNASDVNDLMTSLGTNSGALGDNPSCTNTNGNHTASGADTTDPVMSGWHTDSMDALFKSIEPTSDHPHTTDTSFVTAAVDNATSLTSPDGLADASFAEGFTDLTNFVLGDNSMDLESLATGANTEPFHVQGSTNPMLSAYNDDLKDHSNDTVSADISTGEAVSSNTYEVGDTVIDSVLEELAVGEIAQTTTMNAPIVTTDMSGFTTLSLPEIQQSVGVTIKQEKTSDVACAGTAAGRKRSVVDVTLNTDHEAYTIKRPRRISTSTALVKSNTTNDCADTSTITTSITSSNHSETKPSASSNVGKSQRYRERRDKNNLASKRSRESRKIKFKELEEEGDRLEVENEGLRKKVTSLEAEIQQMKADLIKRMTANNSAKQQ